MTYDVLVVGAGPAGAAAAALCARRGLRVLCVDRGPLDEAGAQWVNGVPASAFDRSGLERPQGEELRGAGQPFVLVAGWDGPQVVIDGHELLEVDMRHLGNRLRTLAGCEGAELRGGVRVLDLQERAEGGVEVRSSEGPIQAQWAVDASGLTGARLLRQGPVAPQHLCAAAQQVHSVRDAAAARSFFEDRGVGPGSALSFSGIEGGFSVLTTRLDGDEVSLLAGSIPDEGHLSGLGILRRFVDQHPWIGERMFGGARAIPVRRPRDCIAEGSVALLGDAACQVFPAHGSGIAAGLLAARMLADALADGAGVEGYAVAWQREHGALMAAYDVFRRFSQSLSEEELRRLVDVGLLEPEGARAGLEQRWPVLGLSALPARLSGAVRAPSLAARFLPVLWRMARVAALYRRYPEDVSDRARWASQVARQFSEVAQSAGAPQSAPCPSPEVL